MSYGLIALLPQMLAFNTFLLKDLAYMNLKPCFCECLSELKWFKRELESMKHDREVRQSFSIVSVLKFFFFDELGLKLYL